MGLFNSVVDAVPVADSEARALDVDINSRQYG